MSLESQAAHAELMKEIHSDVVEVEPSPNQLNSITLTDPKAIKAYEAFRAFLIAKGRTYTGGCTTFYTPEEWKARGEEYGTDALFVIVHDGGDVAAVCNFDYEQYALNGEMTDAMGRADAFVEQCTGWYSAAYSI